MSKSEDQRSQQTRGYSLLQQTLLLTRLYGYGEWISRRIRFIQKPKKLSDELAIFPNTREKSHQIDLGNTLLLLVSRFKTIGFSIKKSKVHAVTKTKIKPTLSKEILNLKNAFLLGLNPLLKL